MKKLLLGAGLLIAAVPAYANVVYNFTSAPVIVNYNTFGEVWDNPGSGLMGVPSVGSTMTASLTFAAALAPNSTTTVSAEAGGYDFIGTSNQGGLVAYYAQGPSVLPITSDITVYTAGSGGNTLTLFRYSSLEGSVTTDTLGNISSWNLRYTLFDNPDPSDNSFRIDTLANTISTFPGIVDGLLEISSGAGTPVSINNVVALNGVGNSNPYNFTGADRIFGDPGSPQLESYTGTPGSWQRVNGPTPAPAPGPLVLLLSTLFLSFKYFFRRK